MSRVQRPKLPLMALCFFTTLNLGAEWVTNFVEGCAVRPLQPYQSFTQSRQSQVPHQSWFLQSSPSLTSSKQVGLNISEQSSSASRHYQNSSPTRKTLSSWSQLLTQAATHLQQFSFSGYNSLHPHLPVPSALAKVSQSQKVDTVSKPTPHLDQGQRIPVPKLHENKNCPPSDPEKNKILVTSFYQQTFGDHNLESLGSFLHPNMIQHNPKISDGVQGLLIFLQSMGNSSVPHRFRTKMKLDFSRVSAEGDLVWVHLRLPLLGRQFAVMDLFRVECGKIAEHWDVVQEITGKVLASSKNGHPFF